MPTCITAASNCQLAGGSWQALCCGVQAALASAAETADRYGLLQLNRRLLGRQQLEALLALHPLSGELVVRREARWVSALRGGAIRRVFLQAPETSEAKQQLRSGQACGFCYTATRPRSDHIGQLSRVVRDGCKQLHLQAVLISRCGIAVVFSRWQRCPSPPRPRPPTPTLSVYTRLPCSSR